MIDRPAWHAAAAAVVLLLLLFAALRWLDPDRGQKAAISLAHDDRAGAPAAAAGGTRGTRRTVFVHVAGAVRRPGVYALPVGSRADVAVERAGGPRRKADLAAVNLAARLEDGQQLLVPERGAAAVGAAPPAAGPSLSAAGTRAAGAPPAAGLSLASATAAQLEELDGIGPALAARILSYRDRHGGFRSVDELREVEGIGEKRLEALRQAVRP